MSNVLDKMDAVKDPHSARPDSLRILMIAPQPWFRPRGTPFSVLHRIRALTTAGHRIDLVTYPFGEDVPLPGLRIHRSRKPRWVSDVKIGPSIAKLRLDMDLYRTSVALLRKNRYDVLHTHEEAAFFGVRLARRFRLLHVYDMHSSLPQQLRNFKAYGIGLFTYAFRQLERRVLHTCDGVITICRDLADIASSQCGTTPHAMIENTGDDSRIFDAIDRDPLRDLGIANKRVFLYTGTLESYQGIELLLASFARVAARRPGIHLVLVGGRPSQVAAYTLQARELGIAEQTTFVGQVHPAHISGFLRSADIIVSPRTRGTNIPLKIYGYLRTSKPLVATDLLTHTQTLTADIAILAPATVEGFASGMTKALDHPDLGKRVAEAAKRFMDGEYSDAAYLRKVNGLYRRVLRAARCS